MPAPAGPRRSNESGASVPSVSTSFDHTAETVRPLGAAPPHASAPPTLGPPAEPGEAGTLGPYRVLKELGRGGMGVVYAALDTRLDRRLALKVMLRDYATDSAAKTRFLREARAAARVKHENVVTIYEADERDGVPYIAMEYLEGYPLDEFLRRKGPPTVSQSLRLMREAATGLAAAHSLGLVHRDIKPANLWLEAPSGRVKVLDFGLAKPINAEIELTENGALVGTPAYMAPEQARGEKVDHRADLFSLGAVMYRLCTGKLPFPGSTTMAVLMALGTEEPRPVRELNPAVPESLAALIHQLLAKNPDARPQSAEEVIRRLDSIEDESAAHVTPTDMPSTSLPHVVSVPIQVTIPPETANPFAGLDSTGAEPASPEEAESPVPKPIRKESAGKGVWVVAGLAAALAVGAVGVILAVRNKDGTETKSPGVAGVPVMERGKSGKTPAGPGKQPTADDSADRRVAEWVLSVGGRVQVNGAARDIRAADELPRERFTLTWVSLASNPRLTDAGLAQFRELKGLTLLGLNATGVTDAGLEHLRDLESLGELDLGGTAVTDAGLAHLRNLKRLTKLYLGGTRVTDAGLKHLRELRGLTWLNLSGAQVTDAGLEDLRELRGLTTLGLKQTKVTAKGLEAFRAVVPGCKIEHDGGTIEPKK